MLGMESLWFNSLSLGSRFGLCVGGHFFCAKGKTTNSLTTPNLRNLKVWGVKVSPYMINIYSNIKQFRTPKGEYLHAHPFKIIEIAHQQNRIYRHRPFFIHPSISISAVAILAILERCALPPVPRVWWWVALVKFGGHNLKSCFFAIMFVCSRFGKLAKGTAAFIQVLSWSVTYPSLLRMPFGKASASRFSISTFQYVLQMRSRIPVIFEIDVYFLLVCRVLFL